MRSFSTRNRAFRQLKGSLGTARTSTSPAPSPPQKPASANTSKKDASKPLDLPPSSDGEHPSPGKISLQRKQPFLLEPGISSLGLQLLSPRELERLSASSSVSPFHSPQPFLQHQQQPQQLILEPTLFPLLQQPLQCQQLDSVHDFLLKPDPPVTHQLHDQQQPCLDALLFDWYPSTGGLGPPHLQDAPLFMDADSEYLHQLLSFPTFSNASLL
ncbi:hypothetical protein HDU80_007792 [Chytriomyces hyalinus]|nr:hypothetical protein HDU80_007792 [Chytriomyces hyalinus]